MEHIELVKGYLQKGLVKPGLDYNLLKEVRKEIEENQIAEDFEDDLPENDDKQEEGPEPVDEPPSNMMVRNACKILFPSSDAQGKHQTRNELFGEKRMAYVVDLDEEAADDIPSTLMRSGVEFPAVNQAKSKAKQDLHNQIVQIMSVMRTPNVDSKKHQRISAVDVSSKSSALVSHSEKIFEEAGDYAPSAAILFGSEKSKQREKTSYFARTNGQEGGRSSGRSSVNGPENDKLVANNEQEPEEHTMKEGRLKRRRIEGEEDAYAELYPVNIGLLEAAGESDEEADFSKMDLSNSKSVVKRSDFDKDSGFGKYPDSREAVPGIKANGGKKTRKNAAAGEKKKLDKQMVKITKILDERQNKNSSSVKFR